MRIWMGLAVLALASTALIAQQAAQGPPLYGGTVLSKVSGGGVAGTTVIAYRDVSKRTGSNRCPEFGAREGATMTAVAGQFLLQVSANLNTFGAVYCHDAFFPRVEPINPRREPGSPPPPPRMAQDPITLIPLNTTAEQTESFLVRELNRITRDIQYAESTEGPTGQKVPLQEALSRLAKTNGEDRDLIERLRKRQVR